MSGPDDTRELAELRMRLLGFFDHAETHLARGNLHAVAEAVEDARRLLVQAGYSERAP